MVMKDVPRRAPGPGVARLGAAAILAALLLPGVACDDNGSHGLRAALDAARTRWAAADLAAYSVDQRRLCFCPTPAAWTVGVAQGQPAFIESVESTGSGEDPRTLELRAFEQAMSVEQLFDRIQDWIETADEIDVTFDADLGFPSHVSVDLIAAAVDDEFSWTLSNVTPLGACTAIGCIDGLRLILTPSGGRFAPGDYEVTVTPSGAPPRACTFTVTVGGSCAAAFCVQGNCALPLASPDRIQVDLPILEGDLTGSVSIDGVSAWSGPIDAVYTRSQPNGPRCPPVCWSAEVAIPLP